MKVAKAEKGSNNREIPETTDLERCITVALILVTALNETRQESFKTVAAIPTVASIYRELLIFQKTANADSFSIKLKAFAQGEQPLMPIYWMQICRV